MRNRIAIFYSLFCWFSLAGQYVLTMQNRETPILEANLRYFTYFTILTNLLVAIYFSIVAFKPDFDRSWFAQPGVLTGVTVHITLVCLTYQVALRHVWKPEGWQLFINEALHSIIPVLVIIYWAAYEKHRPVRYKAMFKWAIYPLLYLGVILLRGSFSGFYPYYFIDVAKIGMNQTLLNAGIIVILFFSLALLFIFIGKRLAKKNELNN